MGEPGGSMPTSRQYQTRLSGKPDSARSTPAWSRLESEMRTCTRCRLSETRTQVVTYRGAAEPQLLFVGEAPGAREDALGVPFVGRSGKVLDEAIHSLGLASELFGITNVVMCRPPANKFDKEAQTACAPWLRAKIVTLAPRLIVTLGAHALESFLPEALPVTQATGRLHSWEGRPLFPLLHPASTFRGRRYQDRWSRDLSALRSALPTILNDPPTAERSEVALPPLPKSS